MSHKAHLEASRNTAVRCAVVTVSDTRTRETDRSGALTQSLLHDHGFEVVAYKIVPDEPREIFEVLDTLSQTAEAILFNGGTGISKRDNTYEAVSAHLEKYLPGFGEIFRMLSYQEIGAAAMLSRATAGLYRDALVFSTPGSTNAVRLAMEKLILPQLKHLVWEVLRQSA